MTLSVISLSFLMLCFGNSSSIPSPQEIDKEKINKVLKEVYELDQKYRYTVDSLSRSKADMAILATALLPMIEQDEKNREVVFPIIDSIIHYQINDLDSLSYKACFLVMQHSHQEIAQLPQDKQDKYYGFVLSLAQDDYISSLNYAWYVDRMNVYNNKAQKYGVQVELKRNRVKVLYPINEQYNKSWEDLGLEFNEEKEWKDVDYPPILISDDEFAILGFIFKKQEPDLNNSNEYEYRGVEGVQVKVNESNYTFTDGFGYFYFVVDKASIPERIQIITDKDKFEYEIESKDDTDFIIINYVL
ncbi:MAG: hypothetical protein PHD06_10265 [Bacteroidales bacterium]|jgi:hypothetical protein|nr:hypothetical protein [Bacteroidales bacterium]